MRRLRLSAPPFCFSRSSLSGCTTFASLNSAARNLDAYELRPLPSQGPVRVEREDGLRCRALRQRRARQRAHRGQADALQVAFLPDGRWVEPTSVHIRNLLARSLANSGRLGLVSTNTVGPLPDFTVMTDVETFQAEIGSPPAPPPGSSSP